MSPEVAAFFEKARQQLADAQVMLKVDLLEAAGRAAYLAGFHAAQALIFEHDGKVLKTHRGVHNEFTRLTRDDPIMSGALGGFLSKAYNLKAIADYETGPESKITEDRARTAIEAATQFVDHIEAHISIR